MSAELVLLEPGETSLAQLAEIANRELRLGEEQIRAGLEHFIRCGEALIAARAQCPQGRWMAWLRENFAGSHYTAHNYMRVAQYQDEVRSGLDRPTLPEAIHYLRGLAPANDAANRARARELAARGVPSGEITALLNISTTRVLEWTKPDVYERYRTRGSRYAARRRKAMDSLRRTERQKQIERAVRKNGGALAEAYAMVSTLDGVLGQARQEAGSKESRLAITEAHALRDKMMEQIVRALGVS